MGDPAAAAAHVRQSLKPGGAWMAVEPMTGRLEDNLNLVGRLYYAGSMIICMPTSLLQEVGAALGAQAGEARLREVIGAGGFQSVRHATQTPLNMLLEARLGTRAFRRLMGGDRPTRGGASNAPAESPQAVAWYTRRRKRASNALSQVANEGFRFAERDRHGADKRGTEGSNPSPSSVESGANIVSAR